MTVEGLKTIFDWVAVILLFLTFVAGLGALITGNVINKRQESQLREFDQGLTTAKMELGKQQERAANADSRVALLEKTASDAKTAQQKVEIELAAQKERTARAQRDASDAALALAKFKAPRVLTPEQQEEIIRDLKPFEGQNFAFAVFPDPEPLALLRILDALLKSAGWKRVPPQIQEDGGVLIRTDEEAAATTFDPGVSAYLAPDDEDSVPAQSALCASLLQAGVRCDRHRTPQLLDKTPRAITISIGKKP
ncbi:MAG TPA: hypothetical protein VMT75_11895 [Candidatus Saccharimonadales bacterium]|nr:hypothetical protein [Candidatus Saccharimonadales bacterium]